MNSQRFIECGHANDATLSKSSKSLDNAIDCPEADLDPNKLETVVLVIDDDPIMRHLFRRYFTPCAGLLLIAKDHEEAECFLKLNKVNILICDYQLDDGPTGVELIKRFRKQYPGILRSMIFSGAMKEEIPDCAQVDYVVYKPNGLSELRRLIKKPLR